MAPENPFGQEEKSTFSFELTQSMQVLIFAAVAWVIWTAGAICAAFGVGALFTRFTIAFGQSLEVLTNIPSIVTHPLDPTAEMPAALAEVFPPAIVFWALFLLFMAIGFRLINAWRLAFVRWQRRDNAGETRWADKADLDPIMVYRGGKFFSRIPVLRKLPGVIPPVRGVELAKMDKPFRKPMLAVENQQSHTLVVAGTRSGKTAGLCIPALLTFEGCVIATSVKNDLIDQTIERRKQMGKVFVFDPVQATEYESAGWSPLVSSRDWREAQRTANSLVDVSGTTSGGGGNMEFFKAMAKQALPCLLYAAAVSKGNMRNVVSWLMKINDKSTQGQITTILKYTKNQQAIDAWKGFVTKEPKLRGDIAATISSALVSYEDERVQKNAEVTTLFPEEFFNGEANTLYVVAPMAEQSRLEPVFVALMQSFLMWVTEQPAPLDTPCLCVLDEAANIAALPQLPELLSTIGGQKVQILTAWQDFSQIQARYGDKKNTILNNSRAKLVLPGVSDPETIRYFSDVAGEAAEEEFHSSDPTKSKGSTHGRRSILNAAVIREQRFGRGILVYGHLPPARVRLRLYFKDKELKRLASGKEPSGSPLPKLLGGLPVIGKFFQPPPTPDPELEIALAEEPAIDAPSAPEGAAMDAPSPEMGDDTSDERAARRARMEQMTRMSEPPVLGEDGPPAPPPTAAMAAAMPPGPVATERNPLLDEGSPAPARPVRPRPPHLRRPGE